MNTKWRTPLSSIPDLICINCRFQPPNRQELQLRLGHRNALCQYFEKIRQYCRTERSAGVRLRSTAWYDFVRVVRNSFSHDFHLNDRLLATKPIKLRFSDRTVTLNKSHQGKEIDFDILPMRYIVELLDVMREFVEKEL